MVALGHAVAYPFGVIGVVLFVQIVPKVLHADMEQERKLIHGADTEYAPKKIKRFLTEFDEYGFAAFGLAIILGILLGSIKIPLTGAGFDGACFSLGNTATLVMTHPADTLDASANPGLLLRLEASIFAATPVHRGECRRRSKAGV